MQAIAKITQGAAEMEDRYRVDWKGIIHSISFGQAHGRCECTGKCGVPHDGRCEEKHLQPAKSFNGRVLLTTMHIDHDPSNCDPSNLRAACQACHFKHDLLWNAELAATTRTQGRRQQLSNSKS